MIPIPFVHDKTLATTRLARPVSTPLGGRSLLFAFQIDVTAKRENYALFDFETLQATSLRFSFYRSAVVLSEQSLKGINARLA